MKNRPLYENQYPGLDSAGKGHQNLQPGSSSHDSKVTRRLVIVSFILSFLMAASLVVMIVMYFQKTIYLNDIENEAKKLVVSFKTGNFVNISKLDLSGFQIMQSLATIRSSFWMLQAENEEARRACEKAGDICRCNNKPTDGWKLHGDHLYYFSTETKNWLDAKMYCMANNSNLVSITSREEQMFLASTRGKNNYWIGLTNERPGGNWYYVDGSEYKEPLFWAPHQPDNRRTPNGKTEHCAEMSNGGSWNDILCSVNSKWICKKQCMAK